MNFRDLIIMPSNILLLSIKPKYAEKIFSGQKKVELRRVRTRLNSGDLVLVYVSSPQKALIGFFEVEKVVVKENLPQELNNLWELVKKYASIEREAFMSYYQGSYLGVCIFVKKTRRFSAPIELQILREKFGYFFPPQSYRYLTGAEIKVLEKLVGDRIAKL